MTVVYAFIITIIITNNIAITIIIAISIISTIMPNGHHCHSPWQVSGMIVDDFGVGYDKDSIMHYGITL